MRAPKLSSGTTIHRDHLAARIAEQSADRKIVVTPVLASGAFLVAFIPKHAAGFHVVAVHADAIQRAECLADLAALEPPLVIREVDTADEFQLRAGLLWPDR